MRRLKKRTYKTWSKYVPQWTASAVNPTIGSGTLTGRYRIHGDTMQVQIVIIFAGDSTAGTGTYRFHLPTGYFANQDSLASTGAATTPLGVVYINDASGTVYIGTVMYGATTGYVTGITHGATAEIAAAVPVSWATNDKLTLNFFIPIFGWEA